MDFIIPRIVKIAEELNRVQSVKVIPGAELTHVPPELIPEKIVYARQLGAKIVVVHGETLVEPVKEGTNEAAINGGTDVLAHPGLISEEEVRLAAEKRIFLEISARKGHSLANGHVARLAVKYNAPLVINTDAHSPDDLITRAFAEKILLASGLDKEIIKDVFLNAEKLIMKLKF